MRLVVRSTLVACLLVVACSRQEAPSAPPGPPAAMTPPPPPPPAAPTVRFVGRFDATDPNAVRFAWSGSAVVARFKGTGISARFIDENAKNVFQVLVDGEPKRIVKAEKGREIYPLVDQLPEGVHEIALYKRTEADVGEVTFLGFDAEGTLLPAPPAAERRMEFIGDSITAGYGNEGPGAVCTFNPNEQNEYLTYGAVAARALDAEHVTIAWSGKTIGQMTDFYERTLPARIDSKWDFKSFIPHVVVMNVGTNNLAVYDPGEEKWVRIYTALYNRIRAAYPEAFIICALGPMLTDVYPPGKQNLTIARRYMKATMAKIKASGETSFAFLEFPEQRHADGLGCGFHPSLKTHKLMADRVVALTRERLGW
ncbi:MAG: endo-1,4-beta-glucanase [Labilithrix sp.]|nr:endo-1,4-beta-glucanase [Labilithrix sp.]